MRKTILICSLFLLIPYRVFAAGPVIYEWMNSTAVCSAADPAPVASNATVNAYLSLGANAYGQSVTVPAMTLYSVSIDFHADSDACVVDVRIGTSEDLSTYAEHWNDVSINNAGELKEFVSVDNDVFSAGTVYIGVTEVSGDCKWTYASSSTYAGGVRINTDTLWNLGAEVSGEDANFKVNKCQ